MKIRNDYVSNSSSSSFILNETDGIRMFAEDFNEFIVDAYEPLGETFHIYIKLKKDMDSWNSTDYDEFINGLESGEYKWDDVDHIRFDCDDWDATGKMYLYFLYRYFEKFGYHPDDSDTEHSFRDGGNDSFLTKILARLNTKGITEDEGAK